MSAYGRLDVYRPESSIETYPLDKPTIGIGRQPGNDIVIDTAGVSRYHFIIELRGDTPYLIDKESQNGTYVDGVKVKADDPHPLREGEEIQAGDARIVYHSDLQADIPTAEAQRIETQQATFGVEIDDTELSVTPGAHIQTLVKVHNTGKTPDTYIVDIDGLPKEWTRLDRLELDVPPGQSGTAVLSIKPTRRSESAPGVYKASLRVVSKEFPESTSTVPLSLTVLSFGGFGMVLGTAQISEGQPFEIYTQNQGSGPLPLTFSGNDPLKRLTFTMQTPSVTLNAGEKRTIQGTIAPRQQRMFGGQGQYRFDVIAHARDASAFQVAISGTYLDKPKLPGWLPYALLGGGGLTAILVLILSAAFLVPVFAPTTTPTIAHTATVLPTLTPALVDILTFTPPPTATGTATATPFVSPSATPDIPTLTVAPGEAVQPVPPGQPAAPTLAPTTIPTTPTDLPTLPPSASATPVGFG